MFNWSSVRRIPSACQSEYSKYIDENHISAALFSGSAYCIQNEWKTVENNLFILFLGILSDDTFFFQNNHSNFYRSEILWEWRVQNAQNFHSFFFHNDLFFYVVYTVPNDHSQPVTKFPMKMRSL